MNEPAPPSNQLLKTAIELGPLLVFFLGYVVYGLMAATAAFMVATAIALTVAYARERTVPLMPLVSGAVVMVFGGLTLWLDSELFIKLKPTIVYGLFAAALLGGLAAGRPLIKLLFGAVFTLNDEGWRQLTLRWGLFFIGMALLNEIVWRFFSTDIWVTFKVFGALPLTVAFAIAQMPLIRRYEQAE